MVWSVTARSDGRASFYQRSPVRGPTMWAIQQCVKDVLRIAYESEDFGQAKARIEQLFVEAKAAHRGHRVPHSITSSAVASSVGGTVRPSAFAVLRLITSSSLVACTTGRSAGLSPLSTRPA